MLYVPGLDRPDARSVAGGQFGSWSRLYKSNSASPLPRMTPRLTVQDPLAAAGAVVFDCRPPLLPASMNVSDVDLSAIQSSTMAAEADVAHYMMAMGLWRPPMTPEIRVHLPLATCNACMSCSDCFPDVPL